MLNNQLNQAHKTQTDKDTKIFSLMPYCLQTTAVKKSSLLKKTNTLLYLPEL